MKQIFIKLQQIWQRDPIFQRVLKNTGYLFSATTISLVLVFIQSILVARLLGLEAFGLITVVMAFVTNINRLFSFRMGEFVIRFFGKELTEGNLAQAGVVVKTAAIIEGFTSMLAFVFLWLLAPLGATLFAKESSAVNLIHIFGAAILVNFITETSTGVLHTTNQFKKQAGLNLFSSVVTLVLITIAFIFEKDVLFILWAYLAGKFILGLGPVILAFRALSKELGTGWWQEKFLILPSIKEMSRFAISTNLSATIKLLVSESEPLWVGFFLDKQAVGLFKIALTVVNPLMMPISPMIDTTFPEIARSVVLKKWQQLKQLLRRTSVIALSWTGFVTLLLVFLGKWIIRVAYGGEFLPAYPTLMILLAGFGFSNIFFWNRKLLLAFGKANIPLYVLAGAAAVKIALAFVYVPQYGINAEAWLLSGNFFLSVGLLVFIGIILIRRRERSANSETV
jgi:O-antigen/teichoic acid export membrane protein